MAAPDGISRIIARAVQIIRSGPQASGQLIGIGALRSAGRRAVIRAELRYIDCLAESQLAQRAAAQPEYFMHGGLARECPHMPRLGTVILELPAAQEGELTGKTIPGFPADDDVMQAVHRLS